MESSFHGRLIEKPTSNLIREIAEGHLSGLLRLCHEDIVKAIFFEQGAPVFAASNLPAEQLEHKLLLSGAVDADLIEEARRRSLTPEGLGWTLVEVGAISQLSMDWSIHELATEIILSVFEWENGTYTFYEDSGLDLGTRLDWPPPECVLAGARRAARNDSIANAGAPPHRRVSPTTLGGPSSFGGLSTLNSVEGFVLSSITAPTPVCEISSLTGLLESDVRGAIYVLLALGLLQLEEESVGTMEIASETESAGEMLIASETPVDSETQIVSESQIASATPVADETQVTSETETTAETHVADQYQPSSESWLAGESLSATEPHVADETLIASESEISSESQITTETEITTETQFADQYQPSSESWLAGESLSPTEPQVADETLIASESEISSESQITTETEITTETQFADQYQPSSKPWLAGESLSATEPQVADETRIATKSLLANESFTGSEPHIAGETLIATESQLANETFTGSEPHIADDTLIATEPQVADETRIATESQLANETFTGSEPHVADDTLIASESQIADETLNASEDLIANELVDIESLIDIETVIASEAPVESDVQGGNLTQIASDSGIDAETRISSESTASETQVADETLTAGESQIADRPLNASEDLIASDLVDIESLIDIETLIASEAPVESDVQGGDLTQVASESEIDAETRISSESTASETQVAAQTPVESPEALPPMPQESLFPGFDSGRYGGASLEWVLDVVGRKLTFMESANYYEQLGVERIVPTSRITDAYQQLRERFESFKSRWPENQELAQQVEALLLKVGQAYETLSDPEKRSAYDRPPNATSKPAQSTRTVKPFGAPSEARPISDLKDSKPLVPLSGTGFDVASTPRSDVARVRAGQVFDPVAMAEQQYNRGRAHFDRRDFHSAVHLFREAAKLDASQSRYHFYLGITLSVLSQARQAHKEHAHDKGCHVTCTLGGGLIRNQRIRREAEQHMLRAAELDRLNAEVRLRLALLYKDAGMEKKAQHYFLETLMLDANNLIAQRELGIEQRSLPY